MDWRDIAIHSAIGMLLAAAVLWEPRVIALWNALFWLAREIGQKPDIPWRVVTHRQSFLEWFVPSLCGLGLAAVWP